jgi:hypothetical protein
MDKSNQAIDPDHAGVIQLNLNRYHDLLLSTVRSAHSVLNDQITEIIKDNPAYEKIIKEHTEEIRKSNEDLSKLIKLLDSLQIINPEEK